LPVVATPAELIRLAERHGRLLSVFHQRRWDAVTDDWFHLMLGYGELRVILQAGSLVRAPGPRFEIHGDQGSLVEYGLDAQAKTLEDGGRPGDPGWGWRPRTATPP
jgi:scyllo-inositol 2-dehydrogenase (NADP+)